MAVYAHSVEGHPEEQWEPLADHLLRVGKRACDFAEPFGGAAVAYAMGVLHDIGKCSREYQDYIRKGRAPGGPKGPDHSTAGAVEATRLYGGSGFSIGSMMAFGLAGHHSGLMDGERLVVRRDKTIADYSGWQEQVPDLPAMAALHESMSGIRPNAIGSGFECSFRIRMLFSCLVDADFLETERFYAAAHGLPVPVRGGRIGEAHRDAVRRYMARHRRADSEVNRLRSAILDHAAAKAALAPGLFTLTVPTGGGKTLTSLSFAVEHALQHGLDRIVYVIPFTSIIEQTAAVFREALGSEYQQDVLEHHASFDWDRKEPADGADTEDEGRGGLAKLRRDAENWDAPIIVTTAVQFFESLFAARTSRARKLHNLAHSAIVIDEAQSIPVHLLRPCMAVLDELARNYGATVILCTATQPALRRQDAALPQTQDMQRKGVRDGLDIPDTRELAPDPAGLYEKLRRVAVEWRPEPVTDAEIATAFDAQEQMLCIVNSRAHARDLFEAVRDLAGASHLSTLMCARHRRKVLEHVRSELAQGKPVRLVATSLIEAGVDVSFPEVWRAAAGISNIAQAAGRCNRSGELGELGRAFGKAVVFEPAPVEGRRSVPHDLTPFYDAARNVLRNQALDPLGLEGVAEYYRSLYQRNNGYAGLDRAMLNGAPYEILRAIRVNIDRTGINIPFLSIADAFRLIDDRMEPVLIAFDAEAEAAIEALRRTEFPSVGIRRRLQQYVVPIPARVRAAMLEHGVVRPVRADYGDQFVELVDSGLYDREVGFQLPDRDWRSNEANIF